MIALPMIIVSYSEVEKKGNHLTILDGIIGQVLARQGFDKIFGSHEFGQAIHEEIKNLDSDEKQAIIEWHGDSLTFEMDMKWNPIVRRMWELTPNFMKEPIALPWWDGGFGE
jgi:hypothetical protein